MNMRPKFFHWKEIDPFQKADETILAELPTLKVYQYPLNYLPHIFVIYSHSWSDQNLHWAHVG